MEKQNDGEETGQVHKRPTRSPCPTVPRTGPRMQGVKDTYTHYVTADVSDAGDSWPWDRGDMAGQAGRGRDSPTMLGVPGMGGDGELMISQAYEEWKKGVSLRALQARFGIPRTTLSRRFAAMDSESREASSEAGTQAVNLGPSTSPAAKENYGETAGKVFELLEKGVPMTQIVIQLKLEPQKVQDVYEDWLELKETDVNEPIVLKRLRTLERKVYGSGWDELLYQARDVGSYKMASCRHNNSGFCTAWVFTGSDGRQGYQSTQSLQCAFCHSFEHR